MIVSLLSKCERTSDRPFDLRLGKKQRDPDVGPTSSNLALPATLVGLVIFAFIDPPNPIAMKNLLLPSFSYLPTNTSKLSLSSG